MEMLDFILLVSSFAVNDVDGEGLSEAAQGFPCVRFSGDP